MVWLNILEAACIRIEKENELDKREKVKLKVLMALIRHGELFFDEITEMAREEETRISEALGELMRKRLVEKNFLKFRVMEPFEAVNSLRQVK